MQQENLLQHLHHQGGLTTQEAVQIGQTVAHELAILHKEGAVYEHVQLRNIRRGANSAWHLIPFEARSTQGQTDYYPPEQAQGWVLLPASDIYAWGCMMYRLLTGKRPFEGETPTETAMQHLQKQPTSPRQLNPDIPPKIEAILLQCLEKHPEKRYQDGAALAQALENS